MELFNKVDVDPKVVVIGGGTGIPTILRGLKKYTKNITSIVTVADDGGGSGVLRDELGILPPGDIRNCLIALANTEPIMKDLLRYRFKDGHLKGQNFGNLFIAAMIGIRGDFEDAIKCVSDVLAITGKVLPVTNESIILKGMLSNGMIVEGESKIPKEVIKHKSRIEDIFIEPDNVNPNNDCIQEILCADAIVFGPGSLYTSILPNLKIKGICDAINMNKGVHIYVSNIMTQYGETHMYTLYDHVSSILKNTNISKLDYIIANNGEIPKEYNYKYKVENSELVYCDDDRFIDINVNIVKDNLIKVENDFIRHDEDKVSRIIMDILNNTIVCSR